MNTETLNRSDVDFELWEQELAASEFSKSSKIELGAAACRGCPLMMNNICPGKASAAAECPPEAKVIQKEQVLHALMDDSVGGITAGEGGFYAMPNKAAMHQTATIPVPKPKIEQPKLAKQAIRPAKSPERARTKKDPELFSALGEFVAMLVGGQAVAPTKK